MGLRGRQYALTQLRWERIAAETMESYRQLMRPPPAATPRVTPRVTVRQPARVG
jgi:hypothetical protein